jgi:hypothetical protein
LGLWQIWQELTQILRKIYLFLVSRTLPRYIFWLFLSNPAKQDHWVLHQCCSKNKVFMPAIRTVLKS